MAQQAAGQGIVMLSGIRQGVPVFWHEAVAVVSGLATWVADAGPDAGVPDLDHLGLSPSGEVFVFTGGKTDADHVRALASLLLAILADGPAPAPLIELATPRASGAVREPLEAFATTLGYFQRPNPAQDVQTLAARIDGHLLNLESNKQLAVLKQKVQQERPAPGQQPPAIDSPRRDGRLPRWLGPALIAVVLAGVIGGAYYFRAELVGTLGRLQTGSVEVTAAPEAAAAPESAPVDPGRVRPPRAEVPLPAPEPVRRRSSATGANSGSGALPAAEPAVETPDGAQPSSPAPELLPPELPSLDSLPTPEPADPTVYTQADQDVEPPSLVYPRLPSEPPPGISEDQIGVVEVLVNEEGLVERVRLVTATNSPKQSMMLWAVKAWIFAPATKDGRPVKYLTRVRMPT